LLLVRKTKGINEPVKLDKQVELLHNGGIDDARICKSLIELQLVTQLQKAIHVKNHFACQKKKNLRAFIDSSVPKAIALFLFDKISTKTQFESIQKIKP